MSNDSDHEDDLTELSAWELCQQYSLEALRPPWTFFTIRGSVLPRALLPITLTVVYAITYAFVMGTPTPEANH
ncbi:hypothetical protein H4R33_004725, partial [Dimargaris cristalligena]